MTNHPSVSRDVTLRVPISDAVEWQVWLTDALSEEAHAVRIGYDGGEEEGRHELHLFSGTDVETVATVARRVLASRGVSGSVTVTDGASVTLVGRRPSGWIVGQPLPGAYGRAVRELCERLDEDGALRSWLLSHGYQSVTLRQVPGGSGAEAVFQEAPPDGSPDELFMIAPVDLSIYDERTSSAGAAWLLACDNMRSILERLAAFLGPPLLEGLPELACSWAAHPGAGRRSR